MMEYKSFNRIKNYYTHTFPIFEFSEAMKIVLQAVAPGVSAHQLCQLGDNYIIKETSKVFQNSERGIAFPTCVSINEIVSNFSPSSTAPDEDILLKEGDVVKVDLAVHIDGYIATLAHTLVVVDHHAAAGDHQPLTGKAADVICAAYYASEVALRLVKEGKTSTDVMDAINTVAKIFNVESVEGTFSHRMKRFLLESEQASIFHLKRRYFIQFLLFFVYIYLT